ncbi:fructosamine-3-kinase [Rubidibacter lacunae KORDI 51-2]|uniref:Fructosamine-3-kinase n=1 Tax=Rubidibacter lacunae KORDI 51-2 TaxID=582515 RepID=U5DP06_9CHRO|nr:fructosamine kinase family protein [Rubidibacter lacunae]ERN41440.1 fructosamine-3-kinase [Rubidibacter lacunae KORDI 51-2]
MWMQIAVAIARATGTVFEIESRRPVGGGSIAQSYAIAGGDRTFFCKFQRGVDPDVFAAEALGLRAMFDTHTIRVPEPICWGAAEGAAYFVMEWLSFGRGASAAAWDTMGRQLAAMHRRGASDRFGWERDNTIGATPQVNPWTECWADFFAEHRIGYQLQLARQHGGDFPDPDRAIAAVRSALSWHQPQPSLVHGDLWSGNAAVTTDGEPAILDPATHYGDREVDLAMTELFGGFPAAFYRGYNAEWPLDRGYCERKDLYNLYHFLNHFNLFGGSYGSQARHVLDRLLQT